MKKIYLILMLSFLISGCNLKEEALSAKDNISKEKVWVFAQFNLPLDDQNIQAYYYYGRVSKPLYEKVKNNQINHGFLLMEGVMYWGNDDLIHEYADGENVGEIVFRIEDIRKIELVNGKPKAGLGSEQFELDDLKNIPPPSPEASD